MTGHKGRKAEIGVLIAAVVVLIVCVAIGFTRSTGDDEPAASGSDAAGQTENPDTGTVAGKTEGSAANPETASAENSEILSANAGGSDENTCAENEGGGESAENAATNVSSGNENAGDENETATDNAGAKIQSGDPVSFPCTAPLDEIRLIALYDYSGYYIEDGSEDAIDSVATLEMTNISDEVIEYAQITLRADGEELTFSVSLIPAGATVLVMEANKKSCGEDAALTYGGSEIAYLDELDLCEESIEIAVDDTGAITVTNVSGQDIGELRLFYKNQLDTGEYIGGIAYTVHITDLAAGAGTTVRPSHFDPTYGVVLMARIYD